MDETIESLKARLAALESASKDAIRREAFEEAAKVCDEISRRQAESDAIARSKSSEKCAAAIRALSQKVGER